MRVTTSLALAALSAAMLGGSVVVQPAAAAGMAPLAAPLGITFATVEPVLPPGISAEQAALARAMGYIKNVNVYANVSGFTLYKYNPAPKLSVDSTIGALVDNEDSKGVLEKYFPGVSTNPALGQARALSLRAVKQFLPGLTDEKLGSIDGELGMIEAPLDPAIAMCTGECAEVWPPFLARDDAQSSALWTVVVRPDGTKQWALGGKPVHSYVKDDTQGVAKGNKAEGKWEQAVRVDAPAMLFPVGIGRGETLKYDARILVDASGMTLYTFDQDKSGQSACVGQCARIWPPAEAPRLAVAVGDFSVVSRDDGIKQWAYDGQPLYTFVGDYQKGMASGDGVAKVWHQAALARYHFPDSVAVVQHPKHGPMLATTDGITLYARDEHRFTLAGGSHDDRSALRGKPSTGAKLGISTCQTDECLEEFAPLSAAPDAQPWGDWTVVDRGDGTSQWAYRSYPLYSYKADKAPGDAIAHDLYELTDGRTGLFWRVALP
jgi:predicted lipoprotein with Yx(FWY)xxD motif